MNTTGIAVITFAGTALFAGTVLSVLYETLVGYPAAVRQRLREMSGKGTGSKSVSLLDLKQLADSASKAPGRWRTWASDVVEQAGLRLELQILGFTSLASAGLLGGAVCLVIPRWWSAAAAVAIGAALPWTYVLMRRRARICRMMRQLPDALDVMCRAVRAGQTVPASIQMVADDFAAPIADEFRQCFEQQNLGISYDAALRNLARRTGIMELRILVVALLVQARSGGSLSELMQNLATTVRKRLVLQQRVRALTGEGRMQAVVLIALPFLVFAAMYVINREYAEILLDHPSLLGACMASQLIGAALMQKMIQIDY